MVKHFEPVAGSHRLGRLEINPGDVHNPCPARHGHRPGRSQCRNKNNGEIVHTEPDDGEREPGDARNCLQSDNKEADRIVQEPVSGEQEAKRSTNDNRYNKCGKQPADTFQCGLKQLAVNEAVIESLERL